MFVDGTLWYSTTVNKMLRKVLRSQEEKRLALKSAHEAGHFGSKRTIWKLKQNYHWSGMSSDCKIYCASCDLCQRRARPKKNQGGNLGRIVATRRGELIGIDLFAGIPVSTQGFSCVLVITDYVTKYTVTVPLRNKKARTVARALYDHWITWISFPERIQSDRGGEFTGKVCKHLYAVCQAKKLQTTPYHPQANGQVERFNQTMADMLSKLCHKEQRKWSEYLGTITMEYNATVHSATKESPHFLLMGKEFWFPEDILVNSQKIQDPKWTNSNFPELMERLEEAVKRVEVQSKRNAKYYNKKRLPGKFKVGQKVWEIIQSRTDKEGGTHRKLVLQGEGPFEIVSISRDENTCRIHVGDEEKTLNMARVKAYTERPEWMKDPDIEEENPEEDQVEEVEKEIEDIHLEKPLFETEFESV
jgi:hypothetical protein